MPISFDKKFYKRMIIKAVFIAFNIGNFVITGLFDIQCYRLN